MGVRLISLGPGCPQVTASVLKSMFSGRGLSEL